MPKPKLILTSLVGTLAYLALAIVGWGDIASFFASPARIALTLVLFAMVGAALFTEGNLSPGEREDRGNLGPLGLRGAGAALRVAAGLYGPS